MKTFDRILNIVLIVVVVLWLGGKLMAPKEPEQKPDDASAGMEAPASDPSGDKEENLQKKAVLQKLPAAPFSTLTAEQLDEAATSDKPVLLMVFASWCPYCKQVFP